MSVPSPILPLDPFLYQEMRWCAQCDAEAIFVAVFECITGRAEVCLGCGSENFERFTRTVSEECAA